MTDLIDLKSERRRLEAAYPAESGLKWAAGLSDCVDLAIQQIWDSVAGPVSGAALVAIGGYGRGHMCPQSDIDLLVLVGRRTDITEPVKGLSYAIWDAGFELGLLTATEKEAHKLAASDFDTRCAFLDSRFLAGDRALFENFQEKALRDVRRVADKFVEMLREACESRWQRAGDAGAELEPDLKRSKGGLRDIAALGWVQTVTQTERSPVDPELIEEGLDLLLSVRQGLHLETGRPNDLLSMQLQIPVAKKLGIDEYELMRRLYAGCRPVGFASDAAFLGPDLLAGATEAFAGVFRDDESKETHGGGYKTLPEWPEEARDAFLQILQAGGEGRRAFRAIDVMGALPAALPEWAHVRHRAQRNIYHRWAVDVHCFETVCQLLEAARSEDDLIREVAADSIKDWDTLLLAGLLHDIGKGTDEDHSRRGERLADESTSRMGIRASAARDVSWLVANHLVLSELAIRRDISEEALIVDVAERVGSERRLRMLYLLSVADAKATGAAAWTPWKANLVSQLFSEVNHLLERKELVGGDASRKAIENAAELRKGLSAHDGALVEKHLSSMPRAWLLSQSPSTLLRQSELMLKAAAGAIELDPRPEGEDGIWEVTVISQDRPGLFSKVSGALALHGLDVVSAQIFTREDGLALEVFRVDVDSERDDRFSRVIADAERALEGQLSLDEALSRKRRDYAGRVEKGKQHPPDVIIDNRASDFYTVIEVHATDRIGLLYEITAALAELGMDIHLAKVATYAEDVVDSFYVRDLEGQKVTDPERLSIIQAKILERVLSAGPDNI